MSSRNNVAKRGSTWTYYVYIVGPDGRRRQISKGGFSTRREAESARVAAASTIGAGMFVRPERITVGEFLADEWLPTQRPPTLEESTYRSYARYVRLHVVPYVGAIPLQRLTPMDLNSLYRKLLDEGRCRQLPPRRAHGTIVVERVKALRRDGRSYEAIAELVADEFPEEAGLTRHAVAALHRRSTLAARPKPMSSPGLKPRTVRYVHTIIHAALKDAMGWNRVARNVADAATAPPVGATRSPRPQAWSSDQLRRFLDHVADSRYLPAWVFLATTGCRRGECLGLKWADIDLDAGTAIISRQVTTIDHVLVEKELPKTKYGHLIRLDTGTVGMLRSWRARQNEEKLLVGLGFVDQGFVFSQPDGRPYDPDRFSREFVRKQEQYNRSYPEEPLPRLVLHGLRHTWATLALHEGIDIKIVSERLNHSSTHVTREIYTHVTPPMQSDAAERVARSIFGPRRT
jgi:integrase